MSHEELERILDCHAKWLRGEDKGERADLFRADLFRANLSEANLSEANLRGANLRGANLRGANLSMADLRGANLFRADLFRANLSEANLSEANLSEADLRGANLFGANLSEANLSEANLRGADLRWADLTNVIIPIPKIPSGDLTAWKKCVDSKGQDVIVKLLIPTDSRRSSATTRKCRAERARVLEIKGGDVAFSLRNRSFAYRLGETVECDKWDENRWHECSGGIHFFLSREEAINFEM